MNRIEALTNYYTSYNEDARLRSKHGMVEFLTTPSARGKIWSEQHPICLIFSERNNHDTD